MTEKQKYLALYICVGIILVLLVTGGIATQKTKDVAPASTLDLALDSSPSSVPASKAASPEMDDSEPVPFDWDEYTNDEFNYAFVYPKEWYKQEYPENFIAFSPNPLPCEDCTYLHNGYFSIKVYDQKTNPEAYTTFQQKMKAIGKVEGYLPARMGGKPAVRHDNTIATENEGNVYEIALEKNEGKANMDNAQIFKRILSSFKFTNLVFTQ